MERNKGNSETNKKDKKYDIEKKEFDFTVTRATELPFNIQTYLPNAMKREEEIPLQNMKRELLIIIKEYVDKNKNKMKNITETQKRGIKSLIKRRNNKEIVIFQTDKTSKITVDSQNNYIEATITHIENE